MKSIENYGNLKTRPEIIRSKRILGTMYGVMAGLGFAGASWGWDGYTLSTIHGYFPWVKLIAGSLLCMIAGGVAGWLTIRIDHSLAGLLVWLFSAVFFAWLTVALPLKISPQIISMLDPRLGSLLDYSTDVEFAVRLGVALAWITPFSAILGLLEIPILEPAVFATSVFGRMIPLLFCVVIMGIAGFISDTLINAYFRDATISMNNTIQFVLDHEGQEIDPAQSRRMFVASLRSVREIIDQPRHLVVGKFDEYFGVIHVYVRFGSQWTDCTVSYNQPSLCKMMQ